MSKNYGNDSQLGEIVKYISDTMKLPIMGAGGGFAPIGTINFFDASVAPQGWLACDGSVVNISDYPDLATYYASVHGSSNFYGGDGTTTFAVPDLRGEFLRGSGTNSHTNQGSGANVGVHQDATEVSSSFRYENNLIHPLYSMTGNNGVKNQDKINDRAGFISVSGTYAESGGSGSGGMYAVRPTNTSFLICVKATLSDANLDTYTVYSPNEHQVAWWEEEIDGVWKRKPVYEKRVDCGALPKASQKTITHNIENIDTVISCRGFCVDSYHSTLNIPHVSTSQGQIGCYANRTTLFIYTDGDRTDFNGKITIQYTKTTDQWQTS